MANTTKTDAKFVPVNESSLSAQAQTLLSKKREADEQSRRYRTELEAMLIQSGREKGLLKPSETFAFGYRFGSLAVAVVSLNATKGTSPRSNAITL